MKKICIIVLVIFACFKSYAINTPTKNDLSIQLASDEDFIRDVQINKSLFNTASDTTSTILSNEEYTQMVNSATSAANYEELIEIFSQYNVTFPENLLSLLDEKGAIWTRIVEKFPALNQLSSDELSRVLGDGYKIVIERNTRAEEGRHAPGCTTNCCDHYVADGGDCDYDFAIATGLTFLGGVAAGVFGSPMAGAAVISLGVGGAYAYHTRCMKTAARNYRICMGYE